MIMVFKLNENEQVELKYSFRVSSYFEETTGKKFDGANCTSSDINILMFCCVIASLQKAKMPTITMLDFMDAVDDYNGGERFVAEFSLWYIKELNAQWEIADSFINELNEVADTKKTSNKGKGKKKKD